ncbi:hypothetical protein Tco_1264381 [Tanacetum coccineum]
MWNIIECAWNLFEFFLLNVDSYGYHDVEMSHILPSQSTYSIFFDTKGFDWERRLFGLSYMHMGFEKTWYDVLTYVYVSFDVYGSSSSESTSLPSLDQRKRARQSSQARPPTNEAVVSVGIGDTTEPIREVITSDMTEVMEEVKVEYDCHLEVKVEIEHESY